MPKWSKNPRDKLRVGRGTLRKHADSGVWYFQYRRADGTWTVIRTGHRDREGAEQWALGFGLRLTRAEVGLVAPEEAVSNDLVTDAFDDFMVYVAKQRSAGTEKTYRSGGSNIKAFLVTRPRGMRLEQFDLCEVLRFRDWITRTPKNDDTEPQPGAKKGRRRHARQNQKKTADNNVSMLRSFFNWCVGTRRMRSNPVREGRPGVQVFFKERKPLIETYTRAEYERILQHAPPELALKVRFMANCGGRIDELANLEPADIDLPGGWLNIRTKITHENEKWTPKDKTDRRVPLNDELRAVLRVLMPAGTDPAAKRYLFPSTPGKWRAKNFARTTLSQLKRLSKATGIPKSKLTSHNFRRYFVSQCADCGIDMLCVMEWVGHDDWEMVRRYYRLREEHSIAAMRRFTAGTPDDERNAAASNAREHPIPPESSQSTAPEADSHSPAAAGNSTSSDHGAGRASDVSQAVPRRDLGKHLGNDRGRCAPQRKQTPSQLPQRARVATARLRTKR